MAVMRYSDCESLSISWLGLLNFYPKFQTRNVRLLPSAAPVEAWRRRGLGLQLLPTGRSERASGRAWARGKRGGKRVSPRKLHPVGVSAGSNCCPRVFPPCEWSISMLIYRTDTPHLCTYFLLLSPRVRCHLRLPLPCHSFCLL